MKPLFVQIKCELGQTYRVAEHLIDDLDVPCSVYSTSGHYDLLAHFSLEENERPGDFVNNKLHQIKGIKDTYTIMAFRLWGGSDGMETDETDLVKLRKRSED